MSTAELMQAEDVLSRSQQKASPLYAGRVAVYPKAIGGRFRTVKWTALVTLLGIYYLVPWLRWDRGPGAPDQAVLVDLPGRRLYFFWIEIWPQEVYFLTGVLVLAAFGLFLATSLFGRLWCGFACPQTIWTDLYLQVERWIEGDRAERIRLDKAPWTGPKVAKRALKHAVWLLIALLTGGAWILYFHDAPTVARAFFTGDAGAAAYFFVGLFTATTYLLAGFAREQVCTFMCPWPRIQGSLVDRDTLAVTYQAWRGEPRGKYRKGEGWEGRGDCIDCKQCVAVCPTGIDIRDGFQLECIGCSLCIDACDDVMRKVGRPPKLIAYDSQRNQELRAAGQPPLYRLARPRTVAYGALCAGVAALLLGGLAFRSGTGLTVLHDPHPLFVRLSDGSIRNGYTVKVLNKERAARTYRLGVEGLDAARLTLAGPAGAAAPASPAVTLAAPPDGVGTHRVYLRLPRAAVRGETSAVIFRLTDTASGEVETFETIFRGPGRADAG
jgi:cytochrome c oxidase accessory protein FixG